MNPLSLLELVILIAGGTSMFLMVWAVYRMQAEIVEVTRLDYDRREEIKSPAIRLLIAFSRPLGSIVRYFALKAENKYDEVEQAHKPTILTVRDRVERNLIAAGSPHGITVDEYLGMCVLCAIIGLLVGVMSMVSTGWTIMIIAGFICGAMWPITWLQAQVQKRKTQIFRSLPFALDLLMLSIEAGLDFTSALTRIVHKISGTPLGNEFAELLRQIQMGQPRGDALRQLAWRVDLEEMGNVTGAMIQADELGASIGPILRIQAEQMRVRREQLAEKKAMEAPVKILLPLILFIFPTVFLIILGPVAIQLLMQNGILK